MPKDQRRTSVKWRSDADSLNAKSVRSSDGLCWSIAALADPKVKFPLQMTVEACNPAAGKNTRFFFTGE